MVAAGDTAHGDVTITVGEAGTAPDTEVNAGDNTLLATADGGDAAAALPGGTASDFFVDIRGGNTSSSADSNADGGEGGAGGSGDGGAGDGGDVNIGTSPL